MLASDNPYIVALVGLLQSIEYQIPLTEGSYLTIRYHLETEEAIMEFVDWVKSRLNGEKLEATEVEIVRAAVQAGKKFPCPEHQNVQYDDDEGE